MFNVNGICTDIPDFRMHFSMCNGCGMQLVDFLSSSMKTSLNGHTSDRPSLIVNFALKDSNLLATDWVHVLTISPSNVLLVYTLWLFCKNISSIGTS